jgi:hypothetical protein
LISDTLILMIFIALWIVTFVLMWALKNRFIPGVGGVIGLLLGLRLAGDVDRILGLVVMFVGLYQLYFAAFTEEKKR